MRAASHVTRRRSAAHRSLGFRWSVCELIPATCFAALLGCNSPQRPARPEVARELEVASQVELTETVRDFVGYFQSAVETAAADIERKSPEVRYRKAAAMWRVRLIEECRATADQADPREVLVDLWTLCYRMHAFLTTGDGKAIFGPSQALAVAASERVNEALERVVQQFVSGDLLATARAQVADYGSANPIRGEFVVAPPRRLSDSPEVDSKLGELIMLPLSPLTALGAVGRTPESVRGVAESVHRFSEVLADLPASARWQLQLLGMNLDESATVTGTVGSFRKLSDSTQRFADNSTRFVQVVDDMPQKVRTQAELLLRTVDESQPQLKSTLTEARGVASAVQGASQDIRQTVTGVDRTVSNVGQSAAALEQAADAVTVAAREILKFIPSTMKDEHGQIIGRRPDQSGSQSASGVVVGTGASAGDTRFSFQAVTESANSLGVTTEKLRRLLDDLRAFVESGSLSAEGSAIHEHMRGTIDLSALQLRGVVDHAAVRTAQLLLLGFVLIIVYRITAARYARPRSQ